MISDYARINKCMPPPAVSSGRERTRWSHMDSRESILDLIDEEETMEEVDDVEMVDVEDGEVVNGKNLQIRQGQHGEVKSQLLGKAQKRRQKKKKNRKRKVPSGSDVSDINRYVLDVCRRLKEKKSYLLYTAVGCLGVSALSDLVHEVEAIQACGGQKTADGHRFRTGGGILWSILKAREPNAYKEIMKRGKEFEKQFRQSNIRQAGGKNKDAASNSDPAITNQTISPLDGPSEQLNSGGKRKPLEDRMRVPVSYDDLVEEPKLAADHLAG